ncbi:MAG: glycoside hydrolase [Lachnospiraceae bacterium]|nr:glycoside hydrolase [Lachnospiraceae bacterium]
MTLEQAIFQNDLDSVKELLIKEPNLIDGSTKDGIPYPFYAAMLGAEDIVRYIVEYSRASMNMTDERHRSILHYAAESKNVSLVSYLVEKVGMSILSGDCDLVTPLDIAVQNNDNAMKAYLEKMAGCAYEDMYRNPILTGMHPDPSIVRVGEDYYMVNSSFIYFPCIPISHSKDLIHWEVIGHAITNPEWAYLDELEGGRGYWAPDISYHEGRFYITATYRLNDTGTIYRRQMVVSSDKPEGPYCKPSFIEEDGIDPSIFTDDDGRRYMLLNRGARIFEISKDGTTKLSKAKLLYYGSQKRAPEGPHLLKKDGYYYLFLAEGGTGPGHRITVSRSRELFGNYEPCPYNPIMRQWDESAPIQRCGHGKPVMTQNGEWYMVYLCGRMIDGLYSMLGRETALDPITWTPDGWPIVNSLQGPSILQKKPSLPEHRFTEANMCYSGEDVLSPEFVTPRPPEEDGIVIENGRIQIKGSKHPLSTMQARNILLVRQKHFNFEASATIDYSRLTNDQEMGLTCYYDENTYLTFGVADSPNGYVLKVTEHIGDTTTSTEVSSPLAAFDHLTLKVVTHGLKRDFYCSINSGDEILFATLDNVYYLCDEGLRKGKRFTGAMTGLYSYAGPCGFLTMSVRHFEYKKV